MTGEKLGFLKVLHIGLLSTFIIILILSVTYNAIQQHSIMPAIKDLGSQFLFSTEKLSTTSKAIIAQGGIYDTSNGFKSGILGLLYNLSIFYMSFYMIYLWIKILAKIVGMSPLSDNGKTFINVTLAILIFIILQSLLILSNAGITKQIDCFSGCDKSAIDKIETPVTSFIDFYHAVPYFIKPAEQIREKVENATSVI